MSEVKAISEGDLAQLEVRLEACISSIPLQEQVDEMFKSYREAISIVRALRDREYGLLSKFDQDLVKKARDFLGVE